MIHDDIRVLASRFGDEIPKPEAKAPFRIKGMGTRRGEPALIYTIPSHTRAKPYEKGVTLSEFSKALSQLKNNGSFERSWFSRNLPECAKEGSCNFTTIGGVLELLGIAKYQERGRYVTRENP
jgi:hypothetical protein